MSTDQQHFDAARQFQEFYDQTLRKVGAKAPQPTLGQSVNDYRREVLRQLKRTFLPPAQSLSGPVPQPAARCFASFRASTTHGSSS
jgi:hypothetical protein